MAYRLAIYCSGTAAHGKQSDFVVEIDESFYNHASGSCASAFLACLPCAVDVAGTLYCALSVSRRAHDGFYHAWYADFLNGLFKLLAG